MKGKKCIGLLILCITFLLSLNLSLNANAITTTPYKYVLPSVYSWQYAENAGTVVDQTANLYRNAFSRMTLNANANRVSFLINKELTFSSSVDVIDNLKFHHKIFYFTHVDDPQYSFVSGNCPRGKNIIIDSCEVKEVDRNVFINSITQMPDPNNSYTLFNGETSIDGNIFQIVDIYGHIDSSQYNSISSFTYFSSWSYFFYNTNTILPQSISVNFYFSPIEFYTENETPSDEVAEKELEDRDNLESQSEETDGDASDSGQAATNTGTTLFGAFTQFVSALNNVSGSSCVLPNMQVYSLDLGQMDLCTYDIPPQIMALVSIGMVFIIVPLGIHLVKKMLSLYKEITG